VPGEVVVQPDHVGVLLAIPNIMTAALAEAVVIVVAPTAVLLPTRMVPGVTSKGVAPDVLTPEKATTEPTAPVVPVPSVKVKLAPSVPSATLYRTEPRRAVPPPRLAPATTVHPGEVGLVELLPIWETFTSITSPAATPAGLAIVRLVLVVVPVVAVPRCAIAADVVVGTAEPITAAKASKSIKQSGSTGILFVIVLWPFLSRVIVKFVSPFPSHSSVMQTQS
jgi:hypothetical protein